MASSKDMLDYLTDQLRELQDVRWRAMMGEYILYYQEKIVGGLYDDRLLVKPTASALAMMPDAPREIPYDGAKEMLLVDRIDDAPFLRALLEAMAEELPAPKKRKPI